MNRIYLNQQLAWAIVLGLLLFSGCSKKDSTESSSSSANDSTSSIVGQGDSDAVAAVRDELNNHWVQTTDGWYSEFPSQISLGTGQRAGPESYYRQFKAFKFHIEPDDLSDSDKLNSIQFRGSVQFDSPPVRLYNDPNSLGAPNQWSDWHPSIENLTAIKKAGKWIIESNGYLLSGTKPSAAALVTLK